MAWIDYKKAYNSVLHLSMAEYLDMFGVADNIKNWLVNSMGKRRLMLIECCWWRLNLKLSKVEAEYF